MTLYEIFKEATISRENQRDPALEKKDRRNKAQMYRGSKEGCKDCQSILKVINGRQTYSYCSPSHTHGYIQVQIRKATTFSASPFLRSPAMLQRQKTGRNVEDLDTANTASKENMQQMETLSTLSFPKRIISAGPGWRLHQS